MLYCRVWRNSTSCTSTRYTTKTGVVKVRQWDDRCRHVWILEEIVISRHELTNVSRFADGRIWPRLYKQQSRRVYCKVDDFISSYCEWNNVCWTHLIDENASCSNVLHRLHSVTVWACSYHIGVESCHLGEYSFPCWRHKTWRHM